MSNVFCGRVASKVLAAIVCVAIGAQACEVKAQSSATQLPVTPEMKAMMYNTVSNLMAVHAFLKAVADGYESGAFTAEQAQLFAQQAIESATTAADGLDALNELDDQKINKATMREVARSLRLLAESGQALLRYTSSKSEFDRQAYVNCRDNAWTTFVTALGRPELKPSV